MIGSARKRFLIALLFLLPNLLGFIVFTAGPVLFSLGMSFTDWALTRHNRFSETPIKWIGIENYERILTGDESHLFWDYFGNTAFLMLGIPLGIAGSLALAMMLNANATPQSPRSRLRAGLSAAAITLVACVGVWLVTTPGPMPAATDAAIKTSEVGLTDLSNWDVARLRSNAAILAVAALGIVATCGLSFGALFFRGLFYLPSLLAGVAMFLLWKTLYRPEGGLINAGLRPIIEELQSIVQRTPAGLWYALGLALAGLTIIWSVWMIATGVVRLAHRDSGIAAFLGRVGFVTTAAAAALGIAFFLVQLPKQSLLPSGRAPLTVAQLTSVAAELARAIPSANASEIRLAAKSLGERARARDAIVALSSAAGGNTESLRITARIVNDAAPLVNKGLTSDAGLNAPLWLVDARWAKIALIIMGFWASIGGGTMLLYLAGLSNIPPELYEAASIDGATGWQRFIHVTWPQLAPTTFFIVIMSTIGGLQGGFEQAMVMTQGKADTIVLAYYIYNVAFTDQFQLGLASAVAWVMFAMIFLLTALNFRLGSQMTNE
jgi:multiple sugar transport system permease protein